MGNLHINFTMNFINQTLSKFSFLPVIESFISTYLFTHLKIFLIRKNSG